MHGAHNRRQIRVCCQDQFGSTPCGTHRRGRETRLAASGPGVNKFAVVDSQPMQLLRIIQAQESIFHLICHGKFAEDVCQMTPSPLNPAGRVEFRKESNDHGVSLPKRNQERQGDSAIRFSGLSQDLGHIPQQTQSFLDIAYGFLVIAISSFNESM